MTREELTVRIEEIGVLGMKAVADPSMGNDAALIEALVFLAADLVPVDGLAPDLDHAARAREIVLAKLAERVKFGPA